MENKEGKRKQNNSQRKKEGERDFKKRRIEQMKGRNKSKQIKEN